MLSEACTQFVIASRHRIHFRRCRICWGAAVDFMIVFVLITSTEEEVMFLVRSVCLLRHVSQRVGLIVVPGCLSGCLSVIPRPTAYHD